MEGSSSEHESESQHEYLSEVQEGEEPGSSYESTDIQ